MKKLLILPLLIFAACTKVDLEQQVEPPVDSTHVACSLSLVKDEIVFDEPYKDSKNAYFYASCDWTVEPTGGESWITIDPASGSGSDKKQKIKITVSENTSGDDRFCEVAFKMDDEIQLLTVRQPKGEIEEEGDDETPPTPPAPQKNYPWTKRVASMHADYYDGSVLNYEFLYDEQGRVLRYTQGNRTYLYEYGDSQVKLYYSDGERSENVIYKFSNGYLSSSDCGDGVSAEFAFDSNGHLVTYSYPPIGGESGEAFTYYWSGDDLISVLCNDKLYENYEYYDIVNKCNVEIYIRDWSRMPESDYMIDRSIFGACAGKHLLKKGVGGSEYTYEFDSEGYVTSVYCFNEYGMCFDLDITYEEQKVKKVSSVSVVGMMFGSDDRETIDYTFKYDNKNRVSRVTEITYSNGDLCGDNAYTYTYTDEGLEISGAMYEEHYGVLERFSVIYSFAFENDFCTGYEYTQTWNDTYREGYSYSYSSSLLSGMNGSWWHSGTEYPESYSYGWTDGNLTDSDWYSCEYYNTQDKSNLEIRKIILCPIASESHEIFTADRNVFKGFHSKDLVKSMGGVAVSYEFDDDGYVVKVSMVDEDYDRYEYTIVYE